MKPEIMTNLRTILSMLYPDHASIRRIIADAGLNLSQIALGSSPNNDWQAILHEARQADQLDQLLAVVHSEYQNNRLLCEVYEAYKNGADLQYPVPPTHRIKMTAPAPPAKFAGRKTELKQLSELLVEYTNVGIVSIGGMGKTSLAQAFCHQQNLPYGAVLWADFEPIPQAVPILQTWGQCIDAQFTIIEGTPPLTIAHRVRMLLYELIQRVGYILVVLDDVWDRTPYYEAVEILKSAMPASHTHMLLTTRQESVIQNLAFEPFMLNELVEADAFALLQNRIKNHIVTEQHIYRVVELLHGHPLALELAAANLSGRAKENEAYVERILNGYQEGMEKGTTFDQMQLDTRTPRSLNVVFARSYDELAMNTQAISLQAKFRMLGVLAANAPWDSAMIKGVWGVKESVEADEAHAMLYDNALIGIDEQLSDSKSLWYRQHPLLRTYARALLNKVEGQDSEQHNRLFTAYATTIFKRVVTIGTNSSTNIAAWSTIQAHILETVAIFSKTGRVDDATFIQILLDGYLLRWGGHKMVIEQYNHLPKPEDAKLLVHRALNIGNAYALLGDTDAALFRYQEAFTAAGDEEDARDISGILGSIANIYLNRGEIKKALSEYDSAIEAAQSVGSTALEAKWQMNKGICLYTQGRVGQAREQYRNAYQLVTREYSPTLLNSIQINYLNNVGVCDELQGDFKTAIQHYSAALQLADQDGDEPNTALCLGNLGRVMLLASEPSAFQHLTNALNICKKFGLRTIEAYILQVLAEAYIDIQDYNKAQENAQQALLISQALKDAQSMSDSAITLSHIHLYMNNWDMAHVTILTAIQQRYFLNQHHAQILRGIVALAKEEIEAATQAFTIGLDHATQLITYDKHNFWAYYIAMIAHCGMAICINPEHAKAALHIYTQVRQLTDALIPHQRAINLLKLVSAAARTQVPEPIVAILNGNLL